jgi:hypothetical protein
MNDGNPDGRADRASGPLAAESAHESWEADLRHELGPVKGWFLAALIKDERKP